MGYPILICLFFLPQILILTIAQPDLLYSACNNDNGNYINNSIYRSNLDTALSLISSNTNSTIYSFYNTSVGQNSDTANALALCRGDVDPVTCGQCVYDSTLKLREICPNQKEAIGWYEFCMLRYSDRSILQNMEDSPVFWSGNLDTTVTNVTQFNDDLRTLMDTLRTRAATGGPLRKFATGNISGSNFLTIYGLVQCTPNLSEDDCNNCLGKATRDIPTCCNGKTGRSVFYPSCSIQYSVDIFFNKTPADATPPPPQLLLPPLSPPPPGKDDNKKHTVIVIVVPIVVYMMFVTVGIRICWGN